MRRLSGFSLMEMMTVLLIVSIVAAASAPMISKKMSVAPAGAGGAGAGGCQWETVDGEGIAYNTEGDKDQTVIIGAGNRPDNTYARLHITSNNVASPHIMLTDSSTDKPTTAKLIYNDGSFGLTTSASALGKNAVAIGTEASAKKHCAVAIGVAANSTMEDSIAIGSSASAHVPYSIAIGLSANAAGGDKVGKSIAIGDNAKTYGRQCISIGARTESGSDEAMGAIAIGSYEDTSVFPADHDKNRTIATGHHSIALGRAAQATHLSATAIGGYTYATNIWATAIGAGANATNEYANAIGAGARAEANNSTAIGTSAVANQPNQIVLGTINDTVYIPGNLIVGNRSYFGSSLAGERLAVAGQWGNGGIQGFIGDIEGNEKFDVIGTSNNYDFRHSSNAPGYDVARNFLLGNGWTSSSDSGTSSDRGSRASDRRLKNVGKAFVGGLKELKKLDLFHYTYKKDKSNTPHVGVMAQDLQKVFPDAVTKGEDGFLRIRMEDMFYALVNAVKELASMFDKQDEKIVQLEKENKQLQKTVADLEKRLAKLERNK